MDRQQRSIYLTCVPDRISSLNISVSLNTGSGCVIEEDVLAGGNSEVWVVESNPARSLLNDRLGASRRNRIHRFLTNPVATSPGR
jgi:hypothetical protein